MKRILLIGCGQVGSQLKRIEEERGNKVYIAELNNKLPEICKYNIAHIAIPYSDNFIMTIVGYLLTYKPRMTIIHSSVPIGTTDKIYKLTGYSIVHSPIIGKHPNLYKNFKQKSKPVSGSDKAVTNACKHLEDILMKPICNGTKTTNTEAYDNKENYKTHYKDVEVKPIDTVKQVKRDFLGYSALAKVKRKLQNYLVKNLYRGKYWFWER